MNLAHRQSRITDFCARVDALVQLPTLPEKEGALLKPGASHLYDPVKLADDFFGRNKLYEPTPLDSQLHQFKAALIKLKSVFEEIVIPDSEGILHEVLGMDYLATGLETLKQLFDLVLEAVTNYEKGNSWDVNLNPASAAIKRFDTKASEFLPALGVERSFSLI